MCTQRRCAALAPGLAFPVAAACLNARLGHQLIESCPARALAPLLPGAGRHGSTLQGQDEGAVGGQCDQRVRAPGAPARGGGAVCELGWPPEGGVERAARAVSFAHAFRVAKCLPLPSTLIVPLAPVTPTRSVHYIMCIPASTAATGWLLAWVRHREKACLLQPLPPAAAAAGARAAVELFRLLQAPPIATLNTSVRTQACCKAPADAPMAAGGKRKQESVEQTVQTKVRPLSWGLRNAPTAPARRWRPPCCPCSKPRCLAAPCAQLLLSGARDELKQLTRQRLEESGWTDEVRQLCRGAVKAGGGGVRPAGGGGGPVQAPLACPSRRAFPLLTHTPRRCRVCGARGRGARAARGHCGGGQAGGARPGARLSKGRAAQAHPRCARGLSAPEGPRRPPARPLASLPVQSSRS